MDINHCIEKTKQNYNILDVWEVKFSLERTVFLSSFSLLNQKGKKKHLLLWNSSNLQYCMNMTSEVTSYFWTSNESVQLCTHIHVQTNPPITWNTWQVKTHSEVSRHVADPGTGGWTIKNRTFTYVTTDGVQCETNRQRLSLMLRNWNNDFNPNNVFLNLTKLWV